MATWTKEDLDKVEAAEELEMAPRRRDGTLRRPVTIWVVRQGDDLYVRSWRGRTGSWFQSAQAQHEARVRAGGVERDVRLVETEERNDEIDAAYRTKYSRYPTFVPPMTTPEARATTLKLVPQSTSG